MGRYILYAEAILNKGLSDKDIKELSADECGKTHW
jgi:hypothetical protein